MGIAIGVDYYPEQWERALWTEDADQMKACGVKLVRMAEFAWSRLEPREGQFDFAWLDEAVRLFADRGIAVILGTPTCTPPLWAFETYPEIIQVGTDGRRVPIGVRGHRCMNSPVYRTLCERMIREMVMRYRDEKAVIGYQIDNELEANHCRCPVCEARFRAWVQEKYQTVDAVNAAYGNCVWSGEYSAFSQVKPPMGERIQWQNPSLTLDYYRYASDSTIEYLELQRTWIHALDPQAIITTNSWLCEHMPDVYGLFRNLDVVSYDNYPPAILPEEMVGADAEEKQEILYSHAFHLDLMRGILRKNFWIMEQLSGAMGSWTPMSAAPKPGMLQGYALQAIAHGADAVLHFRWRTAVSGAEMFWHGILDHSNRPGRRYHEFAALCRTVERWQEIDGSRVINRVALLYGIEQEYGFQLQYQAEGMYYLEQLKYLHDAFQSIGVGVDIIDEQSACDGYDVVLAPNLWIGHPATEAGLKRFARQGGAVVLTARCGVKDVYNKCRMEDLPAGFCDLAGAYVEEYSAAGRDRKALRITDADWEREYAQVCRESFGKTEKSKKIPNYTSWCDIIKTDTAEAMAVYAQGDAAGRTAVTRNTYGDGTVYYIGTVCDRASYIALARQICRRQGIPFLEGLPLGVEVTYRRKEDKCWRFVFNDTISRQTVCLDNVQYVLEPFEMQIQRCDASGDFARDGQKEGANAQ